MGIQFDSQIAELLMKRDINDAQIAANNYEFATNMARMGYQGASNFRDSLAVRIVEESGSGRVRITDPTTSGIAASGK